MNQSIIPFASLSQRWVLLIVFNHKFLPNLATEIYYMFPNLSNQQKVAAIRGFNRRQDLPVEHEVLYNGALYDATKLNYNIFLHVKPDFPQPLSSHSPEKQQAILSRYARLLVDENAPRVSFINLAGRDLDHISIHTQEVNLEGYWTLIHRSVFLHRLDLIVSIDLVATSNVRAPSDYPDPADFRDLHRAPPDIDYVRPDDIRTLVEDPPALVVVDSLEVAPQELHLD